MSRENGRHGLGIAAGIGLAAALGSSGSALAASCTALEAWAGKYSSQQVWELNSIDPRVRLYEVFRGAEFDSVFGKPALAMTDADVKAASDALGACALEARKTRRAAEQRALAGMQAEFTRRLQPLLARVRAAQAQLEPALAALEVLPPSRPLMRSLDVLRQVSTDTDLRPGMGIPEGRQLVTLLAQLPQEAAVQAQPRIVKRYAAVREAVLAEASSALAAAPATAAGFAAVDQTLRQVKYELGPALGAEDGAALEQAAGARRSEIGQSLVSEAIAALQATPASIEGARQLAQSLQRSKHELSRVAGAEELAGLDQAAEERRAAIEAALVVETSAAIDAGPDGIPGLTPLQQVPYQPVMGVLSQPGKDAVLAHAKKRREAILTGLQSRAGEQPATAEGLAALAQMLRDPSLGYLAPDERNRYAQAIAERRTRIAGELLAGPITRLDKFGGNLAELKAMTAFRNQTIGPLMPVLAAQELEPFERAFQRNRERVAAAALPEFVKSLARVPDDDKGIAQIRTARQEVGAGLPAFDEAAAARTGAIQQQLAAAAVEQICGEALTEAKIGKSDAKKVLLGASGALMTLGDVVCRLKIAEQKLNSYESPGLFGGEHKLKLTTSQGVYLTYTLHEAEVAHGKKALVGFKVADANAEKPLSVQEWQMHLATLMPFDDASPPSDRECEAVFDKPDSRVTPFDQARMFACLFSRAKPVAG